MTTRHGGEGPQETADGLAPVIPLFGGAGGSVGVRGADAAGELAPVRTARSLSEPRSEADSAGGARAQERRKSTVRFVAADDADGQAARGDETAEESAHDAAEVAAVAERVLVRKLAARNLSVREATAVLREAGADEDAQDAIVADFLARGYLDDARLAEELVHIGLDRKNQGRQAIALAMSQRGVPREIADAALDELGDDEAERALDVARTKARSLRGLDHEVALRRLVGQLARRGFGSAALGAARQALAEQSSGGTGGGVRFR